MNRFRTNPGENCSLKKVRFAIMSENLKTWKYTSPESFTLQLRFCEYFGFGGGWGEARRWTFVKNSKLEKSETWKLGNLKTEPWPRAGGRGGKAVAEGRRQRRELPCRGPAAEGKKNTCRAAKFAATKYSHVRYVSGEVLRFFFPARDYAY